MRLAQPFAPIEVGEVDNFAFDFTPRMGEATAILSTSWECRIVPYATGSDPDPQSRIIVAQPQGFSTVAMVGPMPPTAAGSNYILDATVWLDDGRILKVNTTVLCQLAGH